MKQVKIILTSLFLSLTINSIFAQNNTSHWQTKQNFISIGIAKPFLMSGHELQRAQGIRQAGLSYFKHADGHQQSVGTYSPSLGWGIGLGFYNPVKAVDRLLWGSELYLGLTGSEPEAGYSEAYYFNYMSFNFGLKYYPFQSQGFYFKLNGGFAGVMTKNRFIDGFNAQAFFHQFGLGINGTGALGYSFVLKNRPIDLIELDFDYKLSNVRVEVNGIGNDRWVYAAIDFKLTLAF